jgi:hypothetical protein
MADPFVNYNAALQAFMQGGRTDTASLYDATTRLRQTSFVGEESTPLSRFYDDVAQRYYEKTEAAKITEESMREDFEGRYKKAENAWLSAAKARVLKEMPRRRGWFEEAEDEKKRKEISELTSIAEFKKMFPSYTMTPYIGWQRNSAERGALRLLTETGERRKASDIYSTRVRQTC